MLRHYVRLLFLLSVVGQFLASNVVAMDKPLFSCARAAAALPQSSVFDGATAPDDSFLRSASTPLAQARNRRYAMTARLFGYSAYVELTVGGVRYYGFADPDKNNEDTKFKFQEIGTDSVFEVSFDDVEEVRVFKGSDYAYAFLFSQIKPGATVELSYRTSTTRYFDFVKLQFLGYAWVPEFPEDAASRKVLRLQFTGSAGIPFFIMGRDITEKIYYGAPEIIVISR